MSKAKQKVAKGKALAPAALVRPAAVEIDMPDDGIEDDRNGLTERQAAFVEAFTNGADCAGNAVEAAVQAGYSKNSARNLASQLLSKSHVLLAIDEALRAAIGTRLTVKAVKVMETIIDSEDATLKLKGDMAAKLIEYSGLVDRTKIAKANETGIGTGKRLAEQTREELEAVVRQGQALLAERKAQANTIELVPRAP